MYTDKEYDDFLKEFEEDETEAQAKDETPEEPDEETADSSPEASTEDDTETQNETDEPVNSAAFWDGLSEKQREEVQMLESNLAKAQHAASSDKGRHKALSAKVAELEAEKAELLQKQESASSGDAEANNSKYSKEELAELADEYPEINAMIQSQSAALNSEIDELRKRLGEAPEPVQENVQENVQQPPQTDANAEYAKLTAAHPDFDDIRKDPNYATWLRREPAGIQALANSPYADDAIALVDRFKSARKPVQDRSGELESMKQMPNKGAINSKAIGEDDFDGWFEHFGKELSN